MWSEFLDLFDSRQFVVVFPGRAAVLRLAGTSGCLDIFSAYLPTGDSTHADDVKEAGYDPSGRVVSNFALRDAVLRRIALQVRPREQTMSLIVGDLNSVTCDADRMCTSSVAVTGSRDHRDESRWKTLFWGALGMHELHQPEPTYASPNFRSRLDRVFLQPIRD